MKPGELYKPVGHDCVLLCTAPDTFTVEAGVCPFHADPATGRIHFDPTPPMHRAWHWSDLATPEQSKRYPDPKGLQAEVLFDETILGGKKILVLNKTLYFYENNL